MPNISTATAVIRAEPDGYNVGRKKLMGRQAAGHGFLRAAVAARGDSPIRGFAATEEAADGFTAIVKQIDTAADVDWIPSDQLNRVAQVGVLYLADATVATHSRQRLAAGMAAFSLCGVTHTTATHGVMDEITGLLREPVAPWDALVCTSSSVVETVRRVHEAEVDYQRWRFGKTGAAFPPQLPCIPLGVHCDDFVFSDSERAKARQELRFGPDEVVGLWVGRLAFHAKAHPYPIFLACNAAAERTGKKVALIFSGWFPNKESEDAFRSGARTFAPKVTVKFVEGRDATLRRQVWAASDLFISPSDNIQETFGLTPVEAMAAGLPVVVSDYDGYRDTVRHEIDGFRAATWAPGPGGGQALARAHDAGIITYDQYCWSAAAATAVDVPAMSDAVSALVESPELRRTMGNSGRQRARDLYDWPVVYRQYQALWADLNSRRRAALTDDALVAWVKAAPSFVSNRRDPFHIFGHYVTGHIGPQTTLSLAPGATRAALKTALGHPLFTSLTTNQAVLEGLFSELERGDLTVGLAGQRLKTNGPNAARAAGLLLKLGLAVAA